ncbi:hypothetical protein R0I01_06255 [Bacillus pumilus]|nr:hypothetical protein R0I01_06255 [Bacillus pumilus]
MNYVCPQLFVIETGEWGYQVYTPNPFYLSSKQTKKRFILSLHKGRFFLYGFKRERKSGCSQNCLNVTGIGPKGALANLCFR